MQYHYQVIRDGVETRFTAKTFTPGDIVKHHALAARGARYAIVRIADISRA